MRFTNPPGGPKRNYNLLAWSKFIFYLLTKQQPLPPPDLVIPSEQVLKTLSELKDQDSVTWLGHNAVLFKLHGKTILTDPFLSDYASPFIGIGPKRFTPPGIPVHLLPPIDVIIISHDHHDHLDLRTLKQIPNKENIAVVVPLEIGRFLQPLGYKKIYELDWHASITLDEITIRALPAYHFCKRGLWERNKRLWANFMITTATKKIYFDGNTAYGSIFLDQGRDYGPFDYALMSIGAYQPLFPSIGGRWFYLKNLH